MNNKENIKSKLKAFFLLAQEIEHLAESVDNFIGLINEAESELDADEDYNLLDTESFICDCVSARNGGYTNLIDYWEEY